MFKNPFSFSGRIRRTEYGITCILYFLVLFLISSAAPSGGESAIQLLLFIPLVWLMCAQGAKRCHDIGNSGWYQLIPFYSLWMLFAESNAGENEYGLNPKGTGNPPTEQSQESA